MHVIECPRCGSTVKLRPFSFSQWRKGQRQCPGCGALLELSNPLLVGGLSGLLFGGFIAGSRYWGFPNQWLRFITVLAICWVLGVIILRTLGHWQVIPDAHRDSPKVRFWSRVLSISGWVAAIAIAVTSIYTALQTRQLIRTLDSVEPEADVGVVEQWLFSFKLNSLIGFGVCGIAFVICIIASFMRRKTRILDQLSISSD